jgi:hypothetical protein
MRVIKKIFGSKGSLNTFYNIRKMDPMRHDKIRCSVVITGKLKDTTTCLVRRLPEPYQIHFVLPSGFFAPLSMPCHAQNQRFWTLVQHQIQQQPY